MSKKYRIKIKKHTPQDFCPIKKAVDQLALIREDLEDAGVEEDEIVNFFSQAYAITGMRYNIEPGALVELLVINGVGFGILEENPGMSPDDLARAVERAVNEEDEPLFDRSKPDPDMPLFLMPMVGEA